MNKFIATLLIYCLTITSVMAGLPPTTLSGDSQTVKPTTFTTIVPNNQATQVSGVKSRIETGSTNLLVNPSFETSTASTGHTLTTATSADDTTHKTDGAKGIAVTPTSNGGGISQTSTTNAASLAGSQGAVKASVYSAGTDVYVCPLMADSPPSDYIRYCGNVPKSTTAVPMPEVIVPFIMDGTSNGYKIYSLTTTPFTVDEVSVGKSAPFQGVNGAKLYGTLTYAAASGCSWSTTSTSYTTLSANASCPTPTVTGQVSAPGTKIPAFILNNAPAGSYYVVAEMDFAANSATGGMVGNYEFNDGTNSFGQATSFAGSGASTNLAPSSVMIGQIDYSTIQTSLTVNVRAKTSNAANAAVISNDTANNLKYAKFSVYYFPPESRIYSQQAYYPSITAQLASYSTSAGSDTLVALDTIASNDGSYSLSSNGVTIVRPGTYKITLKTESTGVNNDTATLKLDVNGTKTSGQLHTAGTTADSATWRDTFYKSLKTGDVVKFYINQTNARTNKAAEMVIDLVDPTPTIVGSFAGIEKCANDYECTSDFSSVVSVSGATGTVSNENLDWINGNCTVASNVVTCGYISNTLKDGSSALSSAMNCTGTISPSAGDGFVEFLTGTTTGFSYRTRNDAGTLVDRTVTVHCQKGTNDFKPKTAKVANSKGVNYTPDTANNYNLLSAYFRGSTSNTACSTGTCTLVSNLGGLLSAAPSRSATGNYSATIAAGKFNGNFGTGFNCWCTSGVYLSQNGQCSVLGNTSDAQGTTLTIFNTTQTGTATDAQVMLFCHGISP